MSPSAYSQRPLTYIKHDANELGGSIMAVLCVHIKPHCLQAVRNLDDVMGHVQMCNRSEVGGHSRHKLCSTCNKGVTRTTARLPLLPVHMRLRWLTSQCLHVGSCWIYLGSLVCSQHLDAMIIKQTCEHLPEAKNLRPHMPPHHMLQCHQTSLSSAFYNPHLLSCACPGSPQGPQSPLLDCSAC